MAKALKKELPRRETGRYKFVLTPLADAMFQLLIFFMLSSNLAPYSLQIIRSGSADQPGEGGTEIAEAVPPSEAAIWTVDADTITIAGQDYDRSSLPALATALSASDDASVVLILRDAALVQDLSSVLEALTTAGIESVQIATGGDV